MNIKYSISFPEPHTHYAEVEMHISDIEVKELNLKMAVILLNQEPRIKSPNV